MKDDQSAESTTTASAADKTRERVLARSRRRDGGDPAVEGEKKPGGFLHELRGWSDALFFAFLLAMFIRTYVFELFMIPTGSMTPTLIGDEGRYISEFDWEGDGDDDIVAVPTPAGYPGRFDWVVVHLREADGRFGRQLILRLPNEETRAMLERFRGLRSKAERNKSAGRKDMILVNKFTYWFRNPTRGDTIVFKVPDRPSNPFDPAKPVYIKRCVALPGERLELSPMDPYDVRPVGHPDRISPAKYGGQELLVNSVPLKIDGVPVQGAPFDRLHHFPWSGMHGLGTVDEGPVLMPMEWTLGDSAVMMFGDNQFSSLDGRAWGEVPLSHLRGKAVLRYWPLRAAGFLDNP